VGRRGRRRGSFSTWTTAPKGFVRAAERYDGADPSTSEPEGESRFAASFLLRGGELAEDVADLTGSMVRSFWGHSMHRTHRVGSSMRRSGQSCFEFRARTSLRDGLEQDRRVVAGTDRLRRFVRRRFGLSESSEECAASGRRQGA